MAAAVASAETVRLSAPDTTFTNGDQVTVTMLLEDIIDGDIASGIESMELALNYSNTLNLISAVNGSALAGASAPVINDYVLDANNNRVQVVGISSIFPIATIEGGEMLELTFQVVGVASFMTADVNLTDLDINESEFAIFNPGFDAQMDVKISVVPIPAAIWLMGSALAGLAGFARRRTRLAQV
jgi:hypothetical protein